MTIMSGAHSVKSMTETNSPSMRVAVLGTGPVALGSAALLLSRGHVPTLWSPKSGEAAPLELHAGAALQLSATVTVAATCADAVASADAVLIAVPATAYRAVLDQLAVALQPGQPVLISGHLSFGALYLAKHLAARGISVPIVAWGTTVVSGRRTAPGCSRSRSATSTRKTTSPSRSVTSPASSAARPGSKIPT
ncbi:MAG: hypothetical protein EOP89_15445, partial [Lysobacteraceae bacterium]